MYQNLISEHQLEDPVSKCLGPNDTAAPVGGQHPGGSTRGDFDSNLDLVLNQGAHLTHLVHATSASCIFIIGVMCLS